MFPQLIQQFYTFPGRLVLLYANISSESFTVPIDNHAGIVSVFLVADNKLWKVQFNTKIIGKIVVIQGRMGIFFTSLAHNPRTKPSELPKIEERLFFITKMDGHVDLGLNVPTSEWAW